MSIGGSLFHIVALEPVASNENNNEGSRACVFITFLVNMVSRHGCSVNNGCMTVTSCMQLFLHHN